MKTSQPSLTLSQAPAPPLRAAVEQGTMRFFFQSQGAQQYVIPCQYGPWRGQMVASSVRVCVCSLRYSMHGAENRAPCTSALPSLAARLPMKFGCGGCRRAGERV